MEQNGGTVSSNNPYRQESNTSAQAMAIKEHQRSLDSEKQVVGSEMYTPKEQQLSLDSEKQVVSSEMSTGPENAPIPVSKDREDMAPIPVDTPEYEAGKEVASSWQTLSKEQSAPIAMEYHESHSSPSGELLNDVKGPPPAYDDALVSRTRSTSSTPPPQPKTPLTPDGGSSLVPARPEDRTAVGQLLSWVPSIPATPSTSYPPLPQPIIIPQLDIAPQGESVPYTRCYSPYLSTHGVSMPDFLSFIDGLSLSQAPNSTLQGLKMFGEGVRKVPLPLIPLAGRGLSSLATSGSGHSSSQARLYLERAKKEYFAPRGLSLVVVRDNELSARLSIPAHASRLAPLTKNSLTESCCRRRLGGLAPYVAPLQFNVPEPEAQLQGVHKMARKHLESAMRTKNKTVTRLRERQWADVAALGVQGREWEEQYGVKMGQLRRVQDDIVEDQKSIGGNEKSVEMKERLEALGELQRAVQLLETRRYMAVQNAAGRGGGVEAEMEEINLCGKLKWIVIESLQS